VPGSWCGLCRGLLFSAFAGSGCAGCGPRLQAFWGHNLAAEAAVGLVVSTLARR
jgi:hypothetical protein